MPTAVAAAEKWQLPVAFPSEVTHGLQLMRNAELQNALLQYDQQLKNDPNTSLRILHGKTAEQQALAAQLRDWLLVLGFQPDAIMLLPSRKQKRQLALEIQ